MGVCCIIFDIDGMLFKFFMNFLNIEIFFLRILFSIFHVFFAFYAISNITKKMVFSFHFAYYKKILKSPPSLTG